MAHLTIRIGPFTVDKETADIVSDTAKRPGLDGNESAAIRLIVKEWVQFQEVFNKQITESFYSERVA